MKYIKAVKHTVKLLSPKFLCSAFLKEIYCYLLSINTITCTIRIKVDICLTKHG